jgi:hypothetical protein
VSDRDVIGITVAQLLERSEIMTVGLACARRNGLGNSGTIGKNRGAVRRAVVEVLEARRMLAVSFSNGDLAPFAWNVNGMGGVGAVNFDAGGNISGGTLTDESGQDNLLTGTYVLGSTGALTVSPGGDPLVGALNVDKDLAAASNNGESSLTLFIKRAPGPGFSTEDLVGTWSIFVNGLAGQPDNPPVSFNDNTGHGVITFTSDGNWTGTVTADESNTTENVSGTFALGGDGIVDFVVTGLKSFAGTMNIGKDIVGLHPVDFAGAAAGNETRMAVLVKSSGTYSNATVKGNWTMSLDGANGSLDLDGAGHFSGAVTTAGGPGVISGTYTVSGAGAFTLNAHTVDSEGPHDQVFVGVVDASHDTIALGDPNSGQDGLNNLIVLISSGQAAAGTGTPPTVEGLTASSSEISRGAKLTLTASSPADADGKIKFVDFFVDSDEDGVLTSADVRVGRDGGAAGGYVANVKTLKLPIGDVTFFAVATDNAGNQSVETSTVVTINNTGPVIKRLVVAPSKVVIGKTLNLIASGAKDADGTIDRVDFYVDSDKNGVLDVGTDELVNSDTSAVGGWKVSIPTADLDPGEYTVFAQATDNDVDVSDVSTAALTVARAGKDLTVESAEVTPGTLDHTTANQSLTVSLMARNAGVASSGAFSEEFFLSTDATLSDDDIALGSSAVATLQGTKSRTESKTFAFADAATVPAAGTYFLIVKIDSAAKVSESDETNNVFTSDNAVVTIT